MAIALDMLHSFSDEEIEELSSRNPEICFERTSDGLLLVSPPTGWLGGSRCALLTSRLVTWNDRAGGGGRVFGSSAGFTLPDGALLSPDAAWLSAKQLAVLRSKQPKDKFAPVCPDLVFEIVSPSDRLIIARQKIETYIRNGASYAVLIDPERRTVEISESTGRCDVRVGAPMLRIPREALPGATAPLQIDLDELFDVS